MECGVAACVVVSLRATRSNLCVVMYLLSEPLSFLRRQEYAIQFHVLSGTYVYGLGITPPMFTITHPALLG